MGVISGERVSVRPRAHRMLTSGLNSNVLSTNLALKPDLYVVVLKSRTVRSFLWYDSFPKRITLSFIDLFYRNVELVLLNALLIFSTQTLYKYAKAMAFPQNVFRLA